MKMVVGCAGAILARAILGAHDGPRLRVGHLVAGHVAAVMLAPTRHDPAISLPVNGGGVGSVDSHCGLLVGKN